MDNPGPMGGVQTGANPAALLGDKKLSLNEGVLELWPNLGQPVARWMLTALARGTGIPLDVPFAELSARHRRMLMHGTGEQWLEVFAEGQKSGAASHCAHDLRH